MSYFDSHIFHIFVFYPLIASLFITLIPTVDMASKLATAKFFSTAGLVVFFRVLFLYLNHQIPAELVLSLGSENLNINFTLFISKYNVFLYGATAALLAANCFMHEINDTKTNIHQVAPFLLAFFLYVCFGQKDLRVALPILSIANFLVYFMIGYTNKIRRGSTIFQMGVFLFSCDALALVLLQIPLNQINPAISIFFTMCLLTPGFARLCLPMLAPFTKKLLLNVDETEGPFIVIFQQLSGFIILILIKNELTEISASLLITISSITILGALYIAIVALLERKIKILPYYYLVYYSSMTTSLLLSTISDELWLISLVLFLTNLACFFFASRLASIIDRYSALSSNTIQLRGLCFISLTMFIGVPGLGMGTSLWTAIYSVFAFDIFALNVFFYIISATWILALILLSLAFILSMKQEDFYSETSTEKDTTYPPIKASMLSSPLFIAIVSWLIPLLIFYASHKGL